MRFRTLEIRWHDSKPISTCDFQPISFKKARPGPGQEKNYAGQSYRLATGGEDNHVRVSIIKGLYAGYRLTTRRLIEYLATLSRHSAAVNVVRFSPNGEHIASAGDDGMIIIWAPSTSPQPTTYGSDLSPEDLQHEKEYWKPRTTFRCTTMQVYDLAWSPTGEYIIAGSTDNVARVFSAVDGMSLFPLFDMLAMKPTGKCVHEIVEHSHYVQGVAWDPLNEYIATQSSDRSMHVYRISTKQGAFEAHAVGKNTRMPHRHSRTPSTSRPRIFTNFFRRLTFSPDGGLLLTPAGQFEDPSFTTTSTPATAAATSPASSVYIYSRANFARPPIAQLPGHKKASVAVRFSPILYELRHGSVFALPYRMLFAVVTMDTVAIYDTQQAGPVCLLTKLHYDEFTDMTWSPDGQCLMLSSRDGYCTLIIFDEILPSHQKQQHALQLQSIAQHHSLPLSFASSHHNNNHNVSGAGPSSTVVTPAATPSSSTIGLPFVRESSYTTPTLSRKRHEPPLTPTASVDGGENALDFSSSSSLGGLHQQGDIMVLDKDDGEAKDKIQEPPKKKRRVALTRVGDLD
ncbi:chromatin assembly complex 1 subunit B/CAC2 [Laccaria bicolor S238N-H82]|uniref:Chromatin assembly complex 1 subunit B/CAC2 n=1 Tax=Laccaria bicolor (strain S238N-H82 / ATCC MYA-4686) TaxID=486041 RepID=B0D507_LACBS|nr:chromatin assembly complex 1 subunit B/CAC2 [Laccaria bicolor S238N-H82]EDR10655.1 chromatin assembly complex 1 subunit B/CAC2 [Laccaria bicolor S238N-H82]|eukprot:XP_001879105.1 chromatin assembly complex 1 subunit B/CAC2 [Laccaria bicolor S238N-H82]